MTPQKGKAEIALDRSVFKHPGIPGEGVMHRLDGTSKQTGGDKVKFELGKDDVVVWEP